MKTVVHHCIAFGLGALLGSSSAFAGDDAATPAPVAPATAAPFAGRLTGDWGGFRSMLAERGVSLDLDSTQYYQGLIDGFGDKDWEFGGRVDAFLHLDTGKMGLWEGGGIHTHLGYFYGNLPRSLGGAVAPNNLGMALPIDSPEELEATSIYLTQRFGERATLSLGKIDTADLPGGDPFFGGYGVKRFMHLAFAAPANGLLPPSIIGGILSVNTTPVTWTFMAYDPNDRTTEYWPDDLFHDGANFALSSTWSGKLAGRASSVTAMGIYSTKDSINLADVLLPADLMSADKDDSWHASLQFSHWLYEKAGEPGKGVNFAIKLGMSDGNPNPYQSWATGGLIAKGMIPGRLADSCGAGYFYYNLSDDLQSAVDPLLSLGDEHGLEAFYDFAVASWFHVTADLQVINAALSDDTAVIGGARASIRF